MSERRIGIMVAMIPSQRWSTLVIWRIRIMGKYLHNIPQILVATRLSSSRGWSLVLLHIAYVMHLEIGDILPKGGVIIVMLQPPLTVNDQPLWLSIYVIDCIPAVKKSLRWWWSSLLCILIIAPPPPPPPPPPSRSLLQKDFTAQCQVCKWSTWD